MATKSRRHEEEAATERTKVWLSKRRTLQLHIILIDSRSFAVSNGSGFRAPVAAHGTPPAPRSLHIFFAAKQIQGVVMRFLRIFVANLSASARRGAEGNAARRCR